MSNWNDYISQTKNYPTRPLLVESFIYVTKRNNALDLGAGSLNDTRRLIIEGFEHIDIVDSNPTVKTLAQNLPKDFVTVFITSFEKFYFPKNSYDLINAQYSIPFAGNAFNEL